MNKPPVFTAAEIATFREEIDRARVPGSYQPGRWSVGALNRDPRATSGLPERIRFRDSTLRSIENMPGVVLDDEARTDYLQRLVRAGVAAIVGSGSAGRTLADLQREVDAVKSVDADCRMVCPLILSQDDLVKASRAGFDAVQVWIDPFGPTAQIYKRIYDMAWAGEDWRTVHPIETREQVLSSKSELISSARALGLDVATPVLMVSYLDDANFQATIGALTEAGVTELTLFDGPGAMGPEAMGLLVQQTRELAPDVEIGVHAHNTFGLATSCAVSAARSGASIIELSVNGYCGGPGNADLAATALAFEALYGVDTGIVLEDLVPLARAGERLTGFDVARNHPVTGRDTYNWGGLDIITQETVVDPLLHNCVDPELVGGRRTIPFTAYSGAYTLADKLDELGYVVGREQVSELLAALRAELARTGAQLDDGQIRAVVDQHLRAG